MQRQTFGSRCTLGTLGCLGLFLSTLACGGGGSTNPAGTGGMSGGGPGSGGAAGGATVVIIPTAMGTLFMETFESGVGNWDVSQGTCSIQADDTSVFNCINGGNEARAFAGTSWGEYSVQARVKVNAMDPTRRIYLAGRVTDSNNWYGAAIYNDTPTKVQIRKKVGGTSSDIAEATYPIMFGTWYTLKLEMKGSTLRLFVDGVLQIETTDTQFNAGKIALLVDRSDVSWDDVLVTNP